MFRSVPLAVLALTLGSAGAQPAPAPFSHVFVIVLENKGFDRVIGNPQLPVINRLAREYGLATNSTGMGHPSLPNYVALISGSTGGSRSDDSGQSFAQPSLPDELEAAGRSWKGYFQALPHAGFAGPQAGQPAVYAKKHNPFMLFPAIAGVPGRAARTVPLDQLSADLSAGTAPDYAMVVPDLCHDLHGALPCRSTAGLNRDADAFVDTWVRAIQTSPAWTGNAAIVITFDEAEVTDTRGGGGRIPTIVIARQGPRGVQSGRPYNHASLLRTLTDAWGLQPLGEGAKAQPMTDLFVGSGR